MFLSKPLLRLSLAAGLFAAVAVSAHFLAPAALAQPDLKESDPEDGAELDEPAEVIHVCFTEPVASGGFEDFEFIVFAPGEQRLGLRIVFNVDGSCADVYPGQPEGESRGEWEVRWEVTSRATDKTGSGSFTFTVKGEAEPKPTPTPTDTGSPTASPLTPTPEPGPDTSGDDGGDGPDILTIALITTGAMLGAGLLGLVLYLLRLRIGFLPHRPPSGEETEDREPH